MLQEINQRVINKLSTRKHFEKVNAKKHKVSTKKQKVSTLDQGSEIIHK